MAEVLAMHADQIERYGGSHDLRDPDLLEAALFRPQTGYYADLIEEAARCLGEHVPEPSVHRRQQAHGFRRHLYVFSRSTVRGSRPTPRSDAGLRAHAL